MELISTFSYDIFLRLTVAVLLGLAIGAERIYAHKAAGMRTYAMVAMGASLFIIISQVVASVYSGGGNGIDPLRMASQIIVGVGFLGSGLIIFKDDKLSGVTTASGLWVSAGIGMASGFGLYGLAIMTTLITLFIFIVVWVVEQRFKTMFETTDTNGSTEKTEAKPKAPRKTKE
ncbi:MAG: MgtC/SapB family protein [Candidatus Pacebacteria bacterium]|nr:MgtC/SapB family protein [Candidatus Paceibacterota bacterium]MBP9852074.1 MgtC/SapB family protein [Candidatus Paceibacterota bacterium]